MFGANEYRQKRHLLAALLLLPVLLLLVAVLAIAVHGRCPQPLLRRYPGPWATILLPGGEAGERALHRSSESPSGESEGLIGLSEFWNQRETYPTGRYDPAWLLRAAEQDKFVPRGVPAGQVIYNKRDSHSPLALTR